MRVWMRVFKDEHGFSLAEIIIAVFLLAVAAAIIGGLMATSAQSHTTSERGEQAVHIAVQEAEKLKSVPFEDLTTQPERSVPGHPGFKVKVDVQPLNAYTKRVTVSVTYPEQSGGRGVQRLVFERVSEL